jgi:hypothetical protein
MLIIYNKQQIFISIIHIKLIYLNTKDFKNTNF